MTQEQDSFDPTQLPVNDADAAEPALPPDQPAKLQPSWILSASGEKLTREEILARYRQQRGLPEDPFESGARPVPPPGYRDRIMNGPRAARFVEQFADQEEDVPSPAPAPRSFTVGQTIAIAAAVALVAGAGAAVLSPRLSTLLTSGSLQSSALSTAPMADAAEPVQPVAQLQLAGASAPRSTVIDKKPIPTATLQVSDVTGETNSLIPLALHAEPGGLEKDMLLKISGVPADAYLTSGHRQDDQVWALSLAEVKNVQLVVPQAKEAQIDLAVAAFETKTGELAAPVKTMTVELKDVVVEPVSGPPPGQIVTPSTEEKSALPGAGDAATPSAIPAPQGVSVALAMPETTATQQLITTADQMFRSGDVKRALRNYERAWGNDGSAAAAFGIARSHDPLVLASLTSSNGTPDKDQAIQWYQRAASAGNPDAAAAIVRLQMKP